MIHINEFPQPVSDHDAEKAANSYLMSLIAIMAGMPLPVLNLIATALFYLHQRKASLFVRWHSTQALLSQVGLFCLNSPAFYWTLSIVLGHREWSNAYFAYIIIVIGVNLFEFIATIYTVIQVRKERHVYWWLFGDIADKLVLGDGEDTV